jgi:hypothetical protein
MRARERGPSNRAATKAWRPGGSVATGELRTLRPFHALRDLRVRARGRSRRHYLKPPLLVRASCRIAIRAKEGAVDGLREDRSPRHRHHSTASAKWPSAPEADPTLILEQAGNRSGGDAFISIPYDRREDTDVPPPNPKTIAGGPTGLTSDHGAVRCVMSTMSPFDGCANVSAGYPARREPPSPALEAAPEAGRPLAGGQGAGHPLRR